MKKAVLLLSYYTFCFPFALYLTNPFSLPGANHFSLKSLSILSPPYVTVISTLPAAIKNFRGSLEGRGVKAAKFSSIQYTFVCFFSV
jgi:hypothetical protein